MTDNEYQILQQELKKHFSKLNKEDLRKLYKSGYDGICQHLNLSKKPHKNKQEINNAFKL